MSPTSQITKRQLAARFVDALDTQPLPQLAAAFMAAAETAGYDLDTERDSLVAMVEYELQARRGAVEVRLTTAHDLPLATARELAAQVASRVGARYHSLAHAIDPGLVGGFEARAGDSTVYASVRAGLAELEARHA